MAGGETAADITRSIVQINAFVDPVTEALVRESAALRGENLAAQESALHVGILRLVLQERHRECTEEWRILRRTTPKKELPDRSEWSRTWHAGWDFTDARRDHVMRQYPLQIRAAGRAVMRMINRQRLDGRGQPLDTPAGRAMELIGFACLAEGRGREPHEIGGHLQRAGMFTNRHTRPGTDFSGWLYPADARRYLDVYPAVGPPATGEMNRRMMRSFGASDNLLARIIRDKRIYPVPRSFEGPGGREGEFFVAPDVSTINREVLSLEQIHGDEITLNQLLRHLGSRHIGMMAVELSGVFSWDRRLPRRARGCSVRIADTPRIFKAYEWLTTLQPGEAGMEELVQFTGLHFNTINRRVTASDREAGRALHSVEPGPGRIVFPPSVVRQILGRIPPRPGLNLEPPEQFVQHNPPQRSPTPLALPVESTEMVEAAAVADAVPPLPEVPARPAWRAHGEIARILGVTLGDVMRTFRRIGLRTDQLRHETPGSWSSTQIHPNKVAEAGQDICRHLLAEKPDMQLSTTQISLLVGQAESVVAARITAAGIAGHAHTDVYQGAALDNALALFDAHLR